MYHAALSFLTPGSGQTWHSGEIITWKMTVLGRTLNMLEVEKVAPQLSPRALLLSHAVSLALPSAVSGFICEGVLPACGRFLVSRVLLIRQPWYLQPCDSVGSVHSLKDFEGKVFQCGFSGSKVLRCSQGSVPTWAH